MKTKLQLLTLTLVWIVANQFNLLSAQQGELRHGPTTIQFYNEVEQAILESLNKRIDFDFDDELIADVVASLNTTYGLNIQVLDSARDHGLVDDEPVSIALSNITLRSGLRLLLDKYDCAFVVQDEVLKIISRDESEEPEYFAKVIYDVTDLKTTSESDLPEAIMAIIDRDSWDKNGGVAKVFPLTVNQRNLIVVNQKREVHDLIDRFLDRLRVVSKPTRKHKPIAKN